MHKNTASAQLKYTSGGDSPGSTPIQAVYVCIYIYVCMSSITYTSPLLPSASSSVAAKRATAAWHRSGCMALGKYFQMVSKCIPTVECVGWEEWATFSGTMISSWISMFAYGCVRSNLGCSQMCWTFILFLACWFYDVSKSSTFQLV